MWKDQEKNTAQRRNVVRAGIRLRFRMRGGVSRRFAGSNVRHFAVFERKKAMQSGNLRKKLKEQDDCERDKETPRDTETEQDKKTWKSRGRRHHANHTRHVKQTPHQTGNRSKHISISTRPFFT